MKAIDLFAGAHDDLRACRVEVGSGEHGRQAAPHAVGRETVLALDAERATVEWAANHWPVAVETLAAGRRTA